MTGKFKHYLDKVGEYRFRLKARNGKNIGSSEGCRTKAAAQNGTESVKNNAAEGRRKRQGLFQTQSTRSPNNSQYTRVLL